jgi:glycerol-3-phosphate dehydrogenase
LTYWDAQFDDARLAIALARTADDRGAAVANYVRAAGLLKQNGTIAGVSAVDEETQERFAITARAVVNASGIFADAVRRLDDPVVQPLLKFSRGSHIVVAGNPLSKENTALLVPRTSDNRVVFAIPWYGHTLIGTTDIATSSPEIEPRPTSDEIAYLVATVNRFLSAPIAASDIRCAFAGLRPLIDRGAATTARLSREHLVAVSRSGLVTIAGGKWTTYRKMAKHAVDAAERVAKIAHEPCPTSNLRLHDETPAVAAMDERERVRYFARHEMARTIEDVLARRMRTLFIDVQAAVAAAPVYAHLLAEALGHDASWERDQRQKFASLASRYSVGNGHSEAKTP